MTGLSGLRGLISVPPFRDDFDRADGDPGKGWIGGQIASNALVITPTEGELLTDGGLETWASASDLTNWHERLAGANTLAQSATKHGGVWAAAIVVDAGNSQGQIAQQIMAPAGAWLKVRAWLRSSAFSGKSASMGLDGGPESPAFALGKTYAGFSALLQAHASNPTAYFGGKAAAASTVYLDDLSIVRLTPASCVAVRRLESPNVEVQAKVLCSASGPAGLVLNLDDPANPQSYLIVRTVMPGLLNWESYEGGVLINTMQTEVYGLAGYTLDPIRVTKVGDQYQAKVNGTSTIRISIGGKAGQYFGLFSTDSANSFDNFEANEGSIW